MDICLQSSSFTTISIGKLVTGSNGVNPRPMELWLLLLNNISNQILTSTRSHPSHFKARDWEPIYSTKRRLNIDYRGSSTLEPVRTLPLSPSRWSTQFTIFFSLPMPKLLRAIPPPPKKKATRGSAMHVFLVTLVVLYCARIDETKYIYRIKIAVLY